MSRDNIQLIAATIFIVLIVIVLTGCTPTLKVLEGATHACGNLHLEGWATDSQGEVVVAKAPAEWTPEQVQAFCNPQ